MYENIFGGNIIDDIWPKYDEKYLERDEINLPVQINGKMKKTISISKEATEQQVLDAIEITYPNLINSEIVKVIYMLGRIMNIICK